MSGQADQARVAANEAAVAAATIGDLESTMMSSLTIALLDYGEGQADRALSRLNEICALARAGDAAAAHNLAGIHYATLLAVVGRLEDAAAYISDATNRARREGNSMALAIWAAIDGMVHLTAGRLSAARAAVEALPRPQRTGMTEPDALRMVTLAEVAAHMDDRNLLQQMVNDAHDAYSTGSTSAGRSAAHVLALAAWHRGDIHDAMRWLGGDVTLFAPPLTPQFLDRLILGGRVASAAGDAGLRARVLQAADLFEREQPAVPLWAGVAGYARGVLEHDAKAVVAAASLLESSSRPLLYAAAAEDAGAELARSERGEEAVHQLNAAFDTYTHHGALADARRVGRKLRSFGVERRIVRQAKARTGWDSLTDSELKVVNLIAVGATNRDVGTELHLSIHTVKTHVHNAFAKLGITSRSQLTQLMHEAE
jgi:ATP/maltotriose-dependent transcriptional regulator MalT